MKRSEVNAYIKEAEGIFASYGFLLPEFARWSAADFAANRESCAEIFDCKLGWDVTDFGSDDYLNCGLLLFTLRNGIANSAKYSKPYAEKIMLVKPGQVTPMHCHYRKQEDIINRGGGKLVFKLHSDDNGKPGNGKVSVAMDGRMLTVDSGSTIIVPPGCSLTLTPGVFHTFCAEIGGKPVVTGEVSSVNDDDNDNCFAEPRKRFPGLEEDVEPYRLLVADY